jgi:UDP-N-acetylglucosamine--N-acetylmuramyl-(pentapeptide) pyrophosphoryl-undecaprenol N-acetylglucosamine transferase
MKKVLIAVGGSGGHILPAEALADDLKKAFPDLELLFVGHGLNSNRFFDRTKFSFKDIHTMKAGMKNPIRLLKESRSFFKGFSESKKILNHFNPDAIVGFGSYHTLPILAAASLSHIPLILHSADITPGRTLRLFAPFAKVSTIYFHEARKKIRGQTILVKHPLKRQYFDFFTKEEATSYFGLDCNLPILLVFGGSQGARGLNKIVEDALPALKVKLPKFQVIHITGSLKAKEELEALYKNLNISACVKEYEQKLYLAWKAAALGIVRSGAGTIAEHLHEEVPCLFIPYPSAKDDHQNKNADYMVWEVGGSKKINESSIAAEKLILKLEELFKNDHKELHLMKKALQVYKQNTNAENLFDVVIAAGKK